MATHSNQLTSKIRLTQPLTALIAINAVIFVALLFGLDPDYVKLPSSLERLAARPWTVVTYMFAQFDVLHLLFNMLWLYWFGSLMDRLAGSRFVVYVYLVGGLAGALLFIAIYSLLPAFAGVEAWLIGSSASVLAVAAAVTAMVPDMKLKLLIFGEVKLKWVALGSIAALLLLSASNYGGNAAHIGGAIAGLVMGLLRRNRPADDQSRHDQLIKIMDKLRRSGHKSLTAEERRLLFDHSQRKQ